jgi:hypothetical protein
MTYTKDGTTVLVFVKGLVELSSCPAHFVHHKLALLTFSSFKSSRMVTADKEVAVVATLAWQKMTKQYYRHKLA